MELINPQLSFIQFGFEQFIQSSCSSGDQPCIPFYDTNDLKFQFIVEVATPEEAETVMDFDVQQIKLYVIEPGYTTDAGTPTVILDLSTEGLYFERHRIADNRILFYWPNGLLLGDALACDQCFQLAIELPFLSDDLIPSTKFCTICDPCFTSVLEYSCDEDAYDFSYCNHTLPNRIRLPFYLTRAQFNDDESVYFRTDGSKKLLKSVTKKEYEGKTELLPESWHEKIKAALSHDNVRIECKRYAGSVSKSGNYEIEWQDFMDYELASAKFKVFAVPYNWRNTNCAVCEPYVEPADTCDVTISDVIITNGSFNAGDYNYHVTWSQSTLPGTLVAEYSLDDGATWTSVVYWAPTGDTEADYKIGSPVAQTHKLRLSPYCVNLLGTQGIGSYIIESNCIPVTFEPVQLPDGYVTQPYSYTIQLAGDSPFTLTNVTKPAWMTIVINDDQIVFSGTPDANANDIEVSFTVNNCNGAASQDFTDSINIYAMPSITIISNTVSGGVRTEVFEIGASVQAGNRFYVVVYSHIVEVTAVAGDTPTTIATKLKDAVNATTPAEWNEWGSAPAPGTPGYPPTATSSGNQLTITLNQGNQFACGAYTS